MSDKELAIKTVTEMPDGTTIQQIADRLAFLAGVRKGLDQIERGETIPHSEVKRIILSSQF